MGNVDGDERDVGLEVLGRDGGGDRLVGLELDDEVDSLANEVLGVAQGHLRLIPVVDHDQLDVVTLGRALQAGVDLAGERLSWPWAA